MRPLVLAFGLVAAACPLAPAIALAECDGPYPSFQNVAPTARRIVIGEVVAAFPGPVGQQDARTSRFTLRGLSVLDGDRPIEIDVTDLQSQQCAGHIIARPGERIAIAFDGHEFGQVVNAVAWLEGQPPNLVGIESTTVRAVYALVGRVPPAARPAASEQAAGPSIDGGVVVAFALRVLLGFAGVLVWRRAHNGAA